jgi:hypothetical protein
VLQRRGQVLQVDVHARMALAEGLQDARQLPVDGEVHVAHAQSPLAALGRALRGAHRAAQVAERDAALHREGVARGRQAHATRGALQQRHAHGLEMADGAAERGLRDIQPRGRAPEVQFLGQQREGTRLAQVEAQGRGLTGRALAAGAGPGSAGGGAGAAWTPGNARE